MEPLLAALICSGPVIWSFGWGYDKIAQIINDREFIACGRREGWTYIGRLKFMCIYPIDGGRAIKYDTVYFGQNGLQTVEYHKNNISKPRHVYDRGYVIYSNSDVPTAILNNPYVSRTSKKSENIRQLWKLLRSTTHTLAKPSAQRRSIQYLDGSINVRIPSDFVSNQVISAYNLTPDRVGGIAYFPKNLRKNFNDAERRRLQNSAERFKPNYATFTMVNTKSVKDLKERTGRSDLSYKNFRPQIVFDGHYPYIEDNINALRIGNMEFTNVTPCIRDEDINLHFMPPRNGIFSGEVISMDPYEFLTEHRPLSNLRGAAYQNLNGAVFGTNFDSYILPENVEPAVQIGPAVENEDEDAIQVETAFQNENEATDQEDTLYCWNFINAGTLIFAKYD